MNRIPGESKPGLGRATIHFGNNSGYQAVNLAYIFGITRMILLGFDMKIRDDKVHFFGDHPYHKKYQGPNSNTMKRWVFNFEQLAYDLKREGVEVLNATRDTALTCFPRVRLEDL